MSLKNTFYILIGISLWAVTQSLNMIAFGIDDEIRQRNHLNLNEIFSGGNTGEDLYFYAYEKTLVQPEQKANREAALSLGLSLEELEAVKNGSVQPIINRENRQLTQAEIQEIVFDAQELYRDILELYELEAEMEAYLEPSEIFANGDLEDSGFDLINDLDLIEEILFQTTSDITVNAKYEDGLGEFLFAESDDLLLSGNEDLKETDNARENLESARGQALGLLAADDDAEFLEAPVCETNDLYDQVKEFENDQNEDAANQRIFRGINVGNGNNDDDQDNIPAPLENAINDIAAANSDIWGSKWCLTNEGFVPQGVSIQSAGAQSLGGLSSDLDLDVFGESRALDTDLSFCFKISEENGRAVSFVPGQSCVHCEVKEINRLLDETLSHSLVPNKATGNLLEAGKCKQGGNLLNFQFNVVYSPIPSPNNDDLVFGNNVFEEWNKYVKRYQPVLVNNLNFNIKDDGTPTTDVLTQQAQKQNKDLAEAYDDILDTKAQALSEALNELETYQTAVNADQKHQFSRNILKMTEEMNQLMFKIQTIYKNTDKKAIKQLNEKPDL
jgi:hypothetical protein